LQIIVPSIVPQFFYILPARMTYVLLLSSQVHSIQMELFMYLRVHTANKLSL